MNQTNEDVSQEKSTTEQTITVLIMRLNQSLSKLDSLRVFPPTTRPHNRDLYRSVYCDIFELSSLTRASLSKRLLDNLDKWRINVNETKFISVATMFSSKIYDELSESGMIDIRARKSATFPIEYYSNQLQQIDGGD